MTRFVQEERWVKGFIRHLSDTTQIKVVTSTYDLSVFPCISIEKNLTTGHFNRLYGDITVSILTDYQGCAQEEELAKKVLRSCEPPLSFAGGKALLKLIKQGRKQSDKKVRHLSFCYHVFVTLPFSECQEQT
jgi:hypothetical protein